MYSNANRKSVCYVFFPRNPRNAAYRQYRQIVCTKRNYGWNVRWVSKLIVGPITAIVLITFISLMDLQVYNRVPNCISHHGCSSLACSHTPCKHCKHCNTDRQSEPSLNALLSSTLSTYPPTYELAQPSNLSIAVIKISLPILDRPIIPPKCTSQSSCCCSQQPHPLLSPHQQRP